QRAPASVAQFAAGTGHHPGAVAAGTTIVAATATAAATAATRSGPGVGAIGPLRARTAHQIVAAADRDDVAIELDRTVDRKRDCSADRGQRDEWVDLHLRDMDHGDHGAVALHDLDAR